MGKKLSPLFLSRAETVKAFCKQAGSQHLTPDQGIQLAEMMDVKITSLLGIFSRIRSVIDVRVSCIGMEREFYPGKIAEAPPDYNRRTFYVPRGRDQGNRANGFCPRCKKLSGRQVALTRDGEFVYCAGCGWEATWEANGLALTATS